MIVEMCLKSTGRIQTDEEGEKCASGTETWEAPRRLETWRPETGAHARKRPVSDRAGQGNRSPSMNGTGLGWGDPPWWGQGRGVEDPPWRGQGRGDRGPSMEGVRF